MAVSLSPHLRRLQAARTALLLDHPFFGVLALQLRVVENPAVPTMCTDGVTLQYSPSFMDTLSNDELIGVVAHEVMHCAAGHPWRRDGRDHKKYNIAADYAINQLLIDAKLTLPKGALIDPQWKGKSSEYIYSRLPNDSQSAGSSTGLSSPGADPAGTGGVSDAPVSDDPTTPTVTETDWKQLAQQSLLGAKMRGQLPASLERELSTALAPVVDWRSLLRKYVTEITRADYSWSSPNRRYLASGLYLPSLQSPACGPIAVAIDTSGSIDGPLLSQFASEVQAIVSELNPRYVDILWCDARLHRVDRFESGEVLSFDPVGGGGTDFRPVFDHYADGNGENDAPACLIYLTDLEGSFPSDAPDYPVIWCTTSSRVTAPFGDTVPCLT